MNSGLPNTGIIGLLRVHYSGDLKSSQVWIWNGQKEVGFGFWMGSKIPKPNHLKAWQMATIRLDFEWSGFWIVGTIATPIAKAQLFEKELFEIGPSKSPEFKCFRISDPGCIWIGSKTSYLMWLPFWLLPKWFFFRFQTITSPDVLPTQGLLDQPSRNTSVYLSFKILRSRKYFSHFVYPHVFMLNLPPLVAFSNLRSIHKLRNASRGRVQWGSKYWTPKI